MAGSRLSTAASVAASTLTHTVPAGNNRLLVACCGHEYNGQTAVTAVDYGGQPMVEAVQIDTPDSGYSAGCSIWYLYDTGIAAATDNVITPTHSTGPADEVIHAASYEDMAQSGGPAATASAESNGSTPNPLIADITETDEGIVIGLNHCGNASSTTWQGDLSEQTDQGDASSSGSMADRLSTTSGSVQVRGTIASQNRAVSVAATFAPAQADVSTTLPFFARLVGGL